MGFLAVFVVEFPAVLLECCQQCHHLAEDLLVGVRELRQPPLEQRVVADLHEMHFTTYEVEHIVGTPIGTPLGEIGADSPTPAGTRTPPELG